MIGQRIEGTLWRVAYRARRLEQEGESKGPIVERVGPFTVRADPPPPHMSASLYVLTADASGADLFEATRRVVTSASGAEPIDFALLQVERVGDSVGGTALVAVPS